MAEEEWEPLDEHELLQGDRYYDEGISLQDTDVGRSRSTLPRLPSWRMPVPHGHGLAATSKRTASTNPLLTVMPAINDSGLHGSFDSPAP